MRTLLLACTLLAAWCGFAAADGWIHCSGPDKHCSASGGDAGSLGAGLALVAAVTFAVRRRRGRTS